MFLSVENISTLKSEKYISEESFNRDFKVYPKKGDVLMTRIGDIGTPNVVETTEKVAYYVSLALLKPIDIDSYFLCNSILSPFFQNGLKKRTLITAIPQKINKDEIGKVTLFIPTSIDEQRKIGVYFTNIDQLITLHQRKLILLNKYKRGLILQNFNYIKENYSFVKLEEICKIIKSGGTPKSNVEEYYNGNIKFLSISDMTKAGQYIYNTEKHISDEGIKNSTAWLVKKGTVVLSMYASYGKSAILMDDMATSQAIIALVLKDNYNPHFLHYMLNYFNILKIWDFFICEGTQKNLNAQIVKNINVFIPPITVQNQIAQTLSSFDCLIEKEEQVLSQLKKYKQGLLQQMFI